MKTFVITVTIDDPAVGVFIPSPNEIHMHVRRQIINLLGGMQRFKDVRSLTALYANLNLTVHTKLEVIRATPVEDR